MVFVRWSTSKPKIPVDRVDPSLKTSKDKAYSSILRMSCQNNTVAFLSLDQW